MPACSLSVEPARGADAGKPATLPGVRSDVELVEAWRSGDTKAGGELFDRHFASIHRFFHNKVGEGLEDLVQQTFLRCTEGVERFRNDSSFRTYLFGVAHNLLREHIKRKHSRPQEVDFSRLSIEQTGIGPSSALGKRAEHRLLLEGLRRIPFDNQVVLELYYWEELSASQMGSILGIPEGTVRHRIRRAKSELRRALKRLELAPPELESTLRGLEDWAASLRDLLGRASD